MEKEEINMKKCFHYLIKKTIKNGHNLAKTMELKGKD